MAYVPIADGDAYRILKMPERKLIGWAYGSEGFINDIAIQGESVVVTGEERVRIYEIRNESLKHVGDYGL